ncbi:MAG: PrgI family protein [Eubacterium sp.]|nr:PrgI family protein [Eubacterium sp.]
MKPIEMNQSLMSVKEKFYGFEIRQIVDALLAGGASLAVNFILPNELGMARGIIASLAAVPFIIVAIKDFYGLKGLKLMAAVIKSVADMKPLKFKSEYINEKVVKKR